MYDIGVINRTNERSVMILKKIRGSIDHHCESKFFTRSSSIPWKRYLFINFDNRIHIPYNILESNEIAIKSRLKKKKNKWRREGRNTIYSKEGKRKKRRLLFKYKFCQISEDNIWSIHQRFLCERTHMTWRGKKFA